MGLPLWILKFTSVFAYFAVHSSAIIPHYDADFSTFSCYRSFIFSMFSRNPVKNALWIKFSVFAFYVHAFCGVIPIVQKNFLRIKNLDTHRIHKKILHSAFLNFS